MCQRTSNAVVKFWICFFLFILFQNEERVLKNMLFALLEESNALFELFGAGNNWHLKTTKIKAPKYCI